MKSATFAIKDIDKKFQKPSKFCSDIAWVIDPHASPLQTEGVRPAARWIFLN